MNDGQVRKYELKEEGYYRMLGGLVGTQGHRNKIWGILKGRFADVISYAVQQPKFYGNCAGSYNDPGHHDSGKIEKYEIQELKKEKGLIEKLKILS